MHCVDCGQNFGDFCVSSHRKMNMFASHQLIPLHGPPKGQAEVRKSGGSTYRDALCVTRCQKHTGMEIDTYCQTCNKAVCSKCITVEHSSHTFFSPLDRETLQKQIDAIAVTKRVNEARKAIATLDGTINKIEEHCNTAEKDIATFISNLKAEVDARGVILVTELRAKRDQLRKTAIQEKGEAESATVQFKEFHSFTKGLLAQETPFDIADAHKKVKA